ncbi:MULTISPECIES: hypothetical protein [unclassified Pseudomonas]|uniref:hypothetical protein n=1 Tax=unclassified Pseudomonas TaxID=196821 RepID=UPI0021BACF70|nr:MULTISPECIES: hypothetical protein [unclassified Pseudomonas]MCT8164995.1 hypothetical protein [Pseudomonas sp. HD6422]MCT8183893.1 hypothetical protein [Pseudomonas sp. HD6421]
MQDVMLKALVGTVGSAGITFGITLSIPSGVITGTLISEKEFKTRFADDFSNAFPGGPHEGLRETFATLGEDAEGYEIVASQMIHLKDAKYVSQNGVMPTGATPMYWRGKIEDVSGFSLGTFNHS